MQCLKAGSITGCKGDRISMGCSSFEGYIAARIRRTVRGGYQSPQIKSKRVFSTVKKPVTKRDLLALCNLQISAICIPKHNNTSGFRKNNFAFIDGITNPEKVLPSICSQAPYVTGNISNSC